jgi:predicted N-acyltransferase
LSLVAVEPRAWDSLCGTTLYSSHAWLEAFAEPEVEQTLVTVEDGGRLLGGLPLFLLPGANENPRYDLFELAGEGARRAWYPQLLAGSRSGYSNGIPVAPELDADERERVVDELVAEVAARAGEAGSAGFLYLDRPDAEAVSRRLDRPHALLLSGGGARLRVAWPDWESYLASLPSARRITFRRERRGFVEAGLTVRVEKLPGREGELAPLLASLRRKHGVWGSTVEACAAYLRACAAGELGPRSVVFLCELGGRTVGFCLAYVFRDTLFVRSAGFDYPCCPGRWEYFNVTFYEPIAYAATHGLAWIDYGTEALRAKRLRGSTLRTLWSVVLPPAGTPRSWWRAIEHRNARRLDALREECGELPA